MLSADRMKRLLATTILGLSLAGLVPTATVASDALPDADEGFAPGSPMLIAVRPVLPRSVMTSPVTQAMFMPGTLDRLPDIARTDTMVISAADIEAEVPTGDPANDIEQATVGLKRVFARLAGPALTERALEKLPDDSWRAIAYDVMERNATGGGYDLDGDGSPDIGIISAWALAATPEQALSQFAGIGAEHIGYAPGTAADYEFAIASHEAEHVRHAIQPLSGLEQEILADQAAFVAMRGRIGPDADMPVRIAGAIRGARAVSALFDDVTATETTLPLSQLLMQPRSTGPLDRIPRHANIFGTDPAALTPQWLRVTDRAATAIINIRDRVASAFATMTIDYLLGEAEANEGRLPEQWSGDWTVGRLKQIEANSTLLGEFGRLHGPQNPSLYFATLFCLRDNGLIGGTEEERPLISEIDAFLSIHAAGIVGHDDFSTAYQDVSARILEEKAAEPARQAERNSLFGTWSAYYRPPNPFVP